mmetsp:Transcript_62562/g.149138  ORF Transcript_62562/g.149138 Transcript_62562/m.149138 type:complete len:238 (+) Transcript_62562:666-1379(+)
MAACRRTASLLAAAPSSCCLSHECDSSSLSRCHADSTSAPVMPASVAALAAARSLTASPVFSASESSRPTLDCPSLCNCFCARDTSWRFRPDFFASSMHRLSSSTSFAVTAASMLLLTSACSSRLRKASLAPAISASVTSALLAAVIAARSLYKSAECAASRSSCPAPTRARRRRSLSLAKATSELVKPAASAAVIAASKRRWSSAWTAFDSSSATSALVFAMFSSASSMCKVFRAI